LAVTEFTVRTRQFFTGLEETVLFRHFNALAKGGHFAAWEQPQLFSEEARAGFRSLRG